MNILIANEKGEVRDSFLTPAVMEKYKGLGNIIENTYDRQLTSAELSEMIKGIDILLTGWGCEPLTKDVLKNADRLKLHVHIGGSVAAYTSKEAFENGIVVLSGNDIFARSVAEGCIAYFLTGLRSIPKYINTMKEKGWKPKDKHLYQGLLYKKVGIVGYGAISKYLCEFLKVFDVELLIYSSHEVQEENARMAALDEIFSTCDIISLHSAWNKKTEGMINKEHLSRIKEDALFVNTARAPIVNEQDLYDELKKGRFYAIFDVYYDEPLSMDNPLRSMDNVLLMPHVVGPTMEMRERVGLELYEDIKRFLEGKLCKYQISEEQAGRMTIEKR